MNQLLALSRVEVLFQTRSGFLAVGCIVTLLWGSILAFVPKEHSLNLLGWVLSMDVASVALLFCVGLHLLEKRQNVLAAFGVVPVNPEIKLLARIIMVSLTATIVGSLIALLYVPFQDFIKLALVCWLNSLAYAVIGYLVAVNSSNISKVIVRLGILSPLWLAPYVSYFDLYYNPIFYLLPTFSLTMLFASQGEHAGITVLNVVVSIVWLAILYVWLSRSYPRALSNQ